MVSQFLTTQRVADELTTSTSHVRRLISAGLLRATRVGKRAWRIRQGDLERFLASRDNQRKEGRQ